MRLYAKSKSGFGSLRNRKGEGEGEGEKAKIEKKGSICSRVFGNSIRDFVTEREMM